MEVLVRNAEGNVSLKDREYAAKKLGRLDRFFHSAEKVEMVHREEKKRHRVEITVFADGFTVRGEEVDADIHAAIDRVSDKLESRLKRLKGRIRDSHRKKGASAPEAVQEEDFDEESPSAISDVKSFRLKPMSLEEAALQMEMVGHDFYLFKNQDDRSIGLLYRRKDGKVGLIEAQ